VGPYRGRPDPISLIPTFERLAIRIAMAAVKRELTEGEHLVAVALGVYFGEENDQLARQNAELKEQVRALQALLMDIYREGA
jgi:hypothetical protein